MFHRIVAFGALVVLDWAGPALAAPPVEAYGKLPAVEQVSLSPSGNRYAFITVLNEKRKLAVLTADGAKLLLMADAGDAKVVGIDWAGEDHLLVKVIQTTPLGVGFKLRKLELMSVLAVSLTTKKVFAVFDHDRAMENIVLGDYGTAQRNGKWYGYFGGIQNVYEPENLYRVDLDTGEHIVVTFGSWLADGWLVGPDGHVIARKTYDQDSGAWQVIAGSLGGRVLASGNSKIVSVGYLARGRSPDTIVIGRPANDTNELEELRLSGEPLPPAADFDKTDRVITDPLTRLWVGTFSPGDDATPKFFAPVAEARIRGALKAFPSQTATLESYTSDLGRMIVRTSGSCDAGTYWLVDIASHAADPIGYAYPGVHESDVGPIQMVDWKAADGLDLHGVLNLPPGRAAKNLPLIVMPHGGPEDRDYPEFWWWSQLFASRGYAVFQPNFRGSAGYGVDFRNAGFGEMGRKMQTDISDGVTSLAGRGIVDSKRACIVGWSYGGYAALAAVTIQQAHYRCAVSMAGLSDLPAFLGYVRDEAGPNSVSMRYWLRFMGVNKSWSADLNPISPVKLAAQAGAPILLIHGKDDTVVPIDQSLEMQRALKAAGKPVELVTLPGADHWLLHEDTRLAMARASLDFVLKYDPPDPEPAQTAQAVAASPASAAP
jgi:dipeptidyl aminopeptidase/acylaminoacyl peptidase